MGRSIRPTRSADREMVDCRIYLHEIQKILEEGTAISRSKRKSGTLEKIMRIRGRRIKVVVVESESHWNDELIWLVIHVGDTRER
jgi:hypothetical protein